jgi:type II secretory pathway predicted ATPase ExeA
MLNKFYGFCELPFGVTPDSRSLFLSRTHREALASLTQGIEARRGFLTLVAEPGMGKTTLLYQLMERLRGTARVVFLFQTQCSSIELIRYLMAELGLESKGKDLVEMHTELYRVLFERQSSGSQFVLFVDEAQNLSHEALETIRLLSNCETPHTKLIQIVLAGQPQLADKLNDPALSQLYQRIAVMTGLRAFGRDETVSYIRNRLQAVGYRGGPLFKPSALDLIAEKSGGVPRRINTLCFNSVSLAYALRRSQIDDEIVNQALLDMHMPSPAITPQSGKNVKSDGRPVVSSHSFVARLKGIVKIRPEFRMSAFRAAAVMVAIAATGIFTQSLREEPLLERTPIQDKTPSGHSGDVGPTSLLAALGEQDGRSGTSTNGTSMDGSVDLAASASVIVGPNETIRQIARKYFGRDDAPTLQAIQDLNPEITNMNQITAGQSVFIPRSVEALKFGRKQTKAESIQKGNHE